MGAIERRSLVSDRRTDDATLIEAVRILSRTIQTDDGVIAACLGKAATRLEELVEERLIVTLPMPFEPWRHGPLSYRKCEVLAALKKAGVKWRKLPPGPEGVK